MSIPFMFGPGKKGVLFEIMPPAYFPWCKDSLETSMRAQVIDDRVLVQELNHRANARRVIDSLDSSSPGMPAEVELYTENFNNRVIGYFAIAIMHHLKTPVSERDPDFYIDFPPDDDLLGSRVRVEMPFPPHLRIPDELLGRD
jgi:hypothetical protein